MKKTITVEEFETLKQSVSTLIDYVEKGLLNADSLKSLHEYSVFFQNLNMIQNLILQDKNIK